MAQWPAYTETRFPLLGVSQCAPKLWRIVSLDWEGGGNSKDAPAVIGPQYPTKGECLADLARYAAENGYTEGDKAEAEIWGD